MAEDNSIARAGEPYDLTVVIPTFNGAARIPLVLERLRSQVDIEAIRWEILVVDNNSHDSTAHVIQTHQKEWNHPFPLRYCFEPEQGLAFARQKAVQDAQGRWVGFLDDDNLPEPTWVKAAYQFAQIHPNAGAFGSKIVGKLEVEPPQELKPFIFYLAIVDRGSQPSQYQPQKNGVPPGAGLVVCRQAWLKYVPSPLFFAGRVGRSLVGAEDAEALVYLHRAGLEIWYNPYMQIAHVIPASRLEKTYFLAFMRGNGLCRHYLRMLMLQSWQRPFMFLAYMVNDSYKVMNHFIRCWSMKDNLGVAVERERLIGTLISPFYVWKVRLDRLLSQSVKP